MAKKIPAPVAVIAEDIDQTLFLLNLKGRLVRGFISSAIKEHEEVKGLVAGYIVKDYEIEWSLMGRLTVAREKARLSFAYFGVNWGDSTDEELSENSDRAISELTENLMRDVQNAHLSGDFNSSSSFDRSIFSAKISARVEMIKLLGAKYS